MLFLARVRYSVLHASHSPASGHCRPTNTPFCPTFVSGILAGDLRHCAVPGRVHGRRHHVHGRQRVRRVPALRPPRLLHKHLWYDCFPMFYLPRRSWFSVVFTIVSAKNCAKSEKRMHAARQQKEHGLIPPRWSLAHCIDSTLLQNHGPFAGSYYCTCQSGYVGDGKTCFETSSSLSTGAIIGIVLACLAVLAIIFGTSRVLVSSLCSHLFAVRGHGGHLRAY